MRLSLILGLPVPDFQPSPSPGGPVTRFPGSRSPDLSLEREGGGAVAKWIVTRLDY